MRICCAPSFRFSSSVSHSSRSRPQTRRSQRGPQNEILSRLHRSYLRRDPRFALRHARIIFSQGFSLTPRVGERIFFSMLAMTASAVYIAVAKQQLINIIVGVLTFYLVATGWAAIKRNAGKIGLFQLGALFVALADVTCAFLFGWQATISADGLRDGYPAAAYFVFGSIALLAAALDVNMLIRGGLSGAPRIARHLWRMCSAFLIHLCRFSLGSSACSQTQSSEDAQRRARPAHLRCSNVLLAVPRATHK